MNPQWHEAEGPPTREEAQRSLALAEEQSSAAGLDRAVARKVLVRNGSMAGLPKEEDCKETRS